MPESCHRGALSPESCKACCKFLKIHNRILLQNAPSFARLLSIRKPPPTQLTCGAFDVSRHGEQAREKREPTNYFDLKKSEGWSWAAVLAAFPGPVGAGQLARALILTRLWVNTPCPHQMEAPWRPSSRVRSHPYRRLR